MKPNEIQVGKQYKPVKQQIGLQADFLNCNVATVTKYDLRGNAFVHFETDTLPDVVQMMFDEDFVQFFKPLQQDHLEERIKEIALEICPNYPDIETVDSMERLYAIESTYQETSLANDYCHKFIAHLGDKLGWSKEEIVDCWLKFKREHIDVQETNH